MILLTLGSIKKNRKFQRDKATLLKSIPDLELSRILECPKKRKNLGSHGSKQANLSFGVFWVPCKTPPAFPIWD